jgi:enoyl-CoA hydratase
MSDSVRVTHEGPVLEIVLDRPAKRNAIDGEMAKGLDEAFDDLDASEARVGVIAGEGEAFCAGADLAKLASLEPECDGFDDERGYLGPTRRPLVDEVVIAAVDGPALAGGLELACLADVRIASTRAEFGVTNRNWGVPLVDGGTQRLPRIVGLGRAMELIATGRVIDAEEAQRIGLANQVVPEGGALTKARSMAQDIVDLPQAALRADKRSVYRGLGTSLAEGLAIEADEGQRVIDREDFGEAAKRFFG